MGNITKARERRAAVVWTRDSNVHEKVRHQKKFLYYKTEVNEAQSKPLKEERKKIRSKVSFIEEYKNLNV